MILHDFRCEDCGVVTEHFCGRDDRVQVCPECSGLQHRVILQTAKPYWLKLAQGDNASPEAVDRFERMHKQQRDKEVRTLNEHGDYGNAPGASGRSEFYKPNDLSPLNN